MFCIADEFLKKCVDNENKIIDENLCTHYW